MLRRIVGATAVAGLVVASVTGAAARSTSRPPAARPTVIATLEAGLNVLHEDFRLAPGQSARLPAGLPPVTRVRLPAVGDFAERREQARSGPLGSLAPGVLHWVEATRLLLYVPDDAPPHDVFADARHGTGVASAAIGLAHGTDPTAFLVVVLADQPDARTWRWLEDARWVDVVSTSYNNLYAEPVPVISCPDGAAISRIVASGRLVVTAAGNGEQLGEVMSPSGHPDAYQVGGVDGQGRSWRPDPTSEHRSFPNRPYETGDRYEFAAASDTSLDGTMVFGATSGAAPSTAGRASELIRHARARTARGSLPRSGPLTDGALSLDELVQLLHRTAAPAEPPGETRYLVEGYGALNDATTAYARRVLDGTATLPDRAAEDAWHTRVEEQRRLLFPAQRCP